jgi:putative ABC transport system permease protein
MGLLAYVVTSAERLWRDARLGLRRLGRAPLFAAFSVATIAIGIGVTTAAYSFVYDFVLRDIGVRDRGTLLSIGQAAQYFENFSWPEYRDLVDQQTAFSSICAWTWFQTSLTGRESSELVSAEGVSGNFFQTLGVQAERGRLIQPQDDRPDAPEVAVLSDAAWRAQFGADPAIVGTKVHTAGRLFEIIGVAAATFHGASQLGRFPQSLWMPLAQTPGHGARPRLDLANRDDRWLQLVGRLAPGRTATEAAAQLVAIGQRLDAISPLSRQANATRRVTASPAFDDRRLTSAAAIPLSFFLSIPALVFLVACTNLMNLVLSRGVSRQHEFAVRRALGASRWRMVREQIADGVMIASVGALAGVFLAKGLITFIDGTILETLGAWPQFRFSSRLELPVLVIVAVAALLALVTSSVLPALQLTKRRGNLLASDTTLGAAPRWRGRSNLIALQVAVSVGLFLVTAVGISVLQTDTHHAVSTGLDRLAMVDMPLGVQQFDDARCRAIVDRVLDEARRLPGVEAVELTTMTSGNGIQTILAAITSPDRPFVPKTNDGERVWVTTVTPGAFKMLGLSLRYGRAFDDRDSADADRAIVINAGLAGKLFGRADAAGRQALVELSAPFQPRSQPKLMTIVGVKEDMVISGNVLNELYVPYAQHFEPNVSFLARGATSDIRPLVTALRTAVRRAEPDVAISFAGRAEVSAQWAPLLALKMFTTGIGSLATVALLLAMAGLYGVLSHVVAMRTRELGLRQALGADASRLIRMILKDGFRPVVEGLLIGVAGAAVIRLALQPSFTRAITAFDPVAFALAAGPLLIAAAIACYVPARRAAKVDPNVALRDL